MTNENRLSAIRITDMLVGTNFVTYQLEIQIDNQLIIYQARYSELLKIFGKLDDKQNPFPSKQYLTTFFKSLLSSKTLECRQNDRYESMKKFFQILSKKYVLAELPEFHKLKTLAKDWQNKITKGKTSKSNKWQQILEKKCQDAVRTPALIL